MVNLFTEKIQFQLGDVQWYNRQYSGALPNNFEAELVVIRRGQIWFKEIITVGELFLQILNWTISATGGAFIDFHHNSIETDENPIFSLTQHPNTSMWGFQSVEGLFNDNFDLTDVEAEEFLRSLAAYIDHKIHLQHGKVDISW